MQTLVYTVLLLLPRAATAGFGGGHSSAVRRLAAAAAPADGGSALAAALEADGVVRVDGAISSDVASRLLEHVDASLADALRATREHEEFSDEWRARFGDIMSPARRHDVKLRPEAPPVRAALAAMLGALRPSIAARLGADAQLYELAALVSMPGAARQPVHADTPIADGRGAEPTILTAFCALQDVDAEMGPTLFLPRTHRAEAHAAFFSYENFDLLFDAGDDEDGEEVDDEREARTVALLDSWSAWRAELGTGDVSLFDSRCLHAGEANASQRRRVLFYASFIQAKAATNDESTRGTLFEGLRGAHTLAEWQS